MSVNALLSTVILVAFVVTVVLAVGSYMAYKIRERSRAPARYTNVEGAPIFFERVYPGRASQQPASVMTTGESSPSTWTGERFARDAGTGA